MIDLLWISLAALFLGLLLVALTYALDVDEPIILGFILCLLTWFVCGLITLVVLSSRSVGRTTCRHWAMTTGYRTKFVILNWADGGTCLALAPDGRWVPNTQIIINSPSKP